MAPGKPETFKNAGQDNVSKTGCHQHMGYRKGMAIASLNVNGLRSHLDEVKILMTDLGIHILALNETKLAPDYPKELTNVAGYQQERLDRTCNGGGVSIYIRDSIKYKPRPDVPADDLEIICIEVEPPKSKSFLVLAWYRPPSDPVASFDKLEKVLSYLDKEGKEIILLGDTNCDLPTKQAEQPIDNDTKHMTGLYELFSFKQLVEEPTRVTLTTSSIIDHVATTCARNIVEAGVHKVTLSDHYMVYCIRKFNGAVEKGHKMINTRKMKNFDKEAFLADVSGICWEQMFSETDDINALVNYWSSLFSLIIDKHAPITEMRVSEKYCPWIDKDLKALMQTRDKLKKAASKRKSQFLMDSYRQVRNKVNAMNSHLKKQYYTDKISSCQGNMKESWKTINELLNKRSKSSNIECLKDLGTETVHKKEISNVMNNFFCSVGKDLANKIAPVPNPLLSGDYEVNKDRAEFNFKTIEVKDIRAAFAKIKTAKSFGIDNISSYFLKLALPYIGNSLAALFNTSIETSQFPDSWKVARVTPIFKEGDKTEKSNYRPISVLPVISRLFEKLVFDQLYQHMKENHLFSPDQSGFLRLHSTLTCLLTNTEEWYNGLDLGQLVGLVFIDLKKAFDTVDHEILCKKLQVYGVQHRELSWFRSYLTCRKQFCRVNGVASDIEDIEVGVPQGSCLGPLLFLIYINDLPQAVQGSTVSMYADDTSLCHQSNDITQLNKAINNDLRHLDTWLQGNKLSLNVAKTNSMLITTKQKRNILKDTNLDLDLNLRENELEVVQKTKYLGVQIDCSLDWKEQIKAVSAKVSRAVGFLKHAKNFLPRETLKTLYTGIVEPHFRYCCSVWGCCGSTEINQLQKLQNRAARIVTNSSFNTPSRPLIEVLGWKTIEQLISIESKTMVFKSLNELAPQCLCGLFTKNSQCSTRTLRNTGTDVRLPKKNSANGKKCFSFRGAKLWNSLSAESKQASSLNSFKKSI